MNHFKRSKRLSRIIACLLISTSVFSASAIVNVKNSSWASHAWSFWPFSRSQEEKMELKSSIDNLLDQCTDVVKQLNDTQKCSDFLKEASVLKAEAKKLEDNYDDLYDVLERTDNLFRKINIALDLQEIEIRQKKEKEFDEKLRLEEERLRKLEEQKLEEERIEKERLEKLGNAKDKLIDKIEYIIGNAKKKLKNINTINSIEARAGEIANKINAVTNIDRLSDVETIINELEDNTNKDILAEVQASKAAFEKLLKETKSELSKKLENAVSDISDIDITSSFYINVQKIITEINNYISNLTDVNTREIDERIESINVVISEFRIEQARIAAEQKALAEQEANIDDHRDFEKQLELLRDGKLNIDHVVGGNAKAKAKLTALVSAFEKYKKGSKIKPSKGILMYGPPGTGKTTLARSMAAYRNMEVIMVTPSMLMEADGPQKVIQLVELAKKSAKISGKLVALIIDEIDAIAQIRSNSGSDKVLVSLLNSLDKLNPEDGVVIFATTNRKEALDTAIVRSGRIDQSVEVGYPNQKDIVEILDIRLKYLTLNKDIDLNYLASKMKRFHGADIVKVVEIALSISVERNEVSELSKATILKEDLEKGIATVIDERTETLIV